MMAGGGSEASRKCERGRLRREVGRWLAGYYSVYITLTFTILSRKDLALYTLITETSNVIVTV